MQDLKRIVDDMKDGLKDLYKKDSSAVWHNPAIMLIETDKVASVQVADDTIVDRLRDGVGRGLLKGIVVGRMVAKYSETIKDLNGEPQMLEKAILVSGRMFSNGQTYVVIVPCREHKDLRNPLGDTAENAEPQNNAPYVPGVTSPDAVQKIVSDGGNVRGFIFVQFGDEQIFDSRRGDRCMLDPLIEGIIQTPSVQQ